MTCNAFYKSSANHAMRSIQTCKPVHGSKGESIKHNRTLRVQEAKVKAGDKAKARQTKELET